MARELDRDTRQGTADDAAAGAGGVGPGPRGFIVRVPDDAMRPAFRAGDFAYVDPDVPVAPGAFVCVRRDKTTTVRLYAEERGRRVLRTLEPDRVEGTVDAGNADGGTTIRGVVVFVGRRVGQV